MTKALKARDESYHSPMSRLQRFVDPVSSYAGALPQAVTSRAFGAGKGVRTAFLSFLLIVFIVSAYSIVSTTAYPSSKRTLRVMSYNIHVCVGMDKMR